MHDFKHQIIVTYRIHPANKHLLPMTIRLVSSGVKLRAISSFIPVIEPYCPKRKSILVNTITMLDDGSLFDDNTY